MNRERVDRALLTPLLDGFGMDRPALRAAPAGSQMVGLLLMRHVLGAEPLGRQEGRPAGGCGRRGGAALLDRAPARSVAAPSGALHAGRPGRGSPGQGSSVPTR
ncbi:hypothetical protein [Streptomyces sp. NPDC048590]|uniref:TetR/AcrR family transcriptional regulator n=1 Tax=Streptomyces sp. NPDC048590 TaxID=3365574 RepID=UPI003721486D